MDLNGDIMGLKIELIKAIVHINDIVHVNNTIEEQINDLNDNFKNRVLNLIDFLNKIDYTNINFLQHHIYLTTNEKITGFVYFHRNAKLIFQNGFKVAIDRTAFDTEDYNYLFATFEGKLLKLEKKIYSIREFK